jgi:hypothetical protein
MNFEKVQVCKPNAIQKSGLYVSGNKSRLCDTRLINRLRNLKA